jgi:hypothetical protein
MHIFVSIMFVISDEADSDVEDAHADSNRLCNYFVALYLIVKYD